VRIAFFSPLPPAKSGIADYSAALLQEMKRMADVTEFSARRGDYDPSQFDIALYQIGNNIHHDFCYDAALRHPGVAVIHEANLHHLIAEMTIKRGDWDAYMAEVKWNGSAADLEYATHRVRTLQAGPQYETVPMLRRLLGCARGAIVHSNCVAAELRKNGFAGPIARIPHGAWIPAADRMGWRTRLGLDESTPLIGIFGFLKPYKRIAESLRAFRRLLRVEPGVKMILVGEAHPELRLDAIIRSLGISDSVRTLGFTPIEDFAGYIAASDIVLNLRFPTVGENSGTLMRCLGLGKAVLVSDVGSFSELPDDICLKVPVDSTEEDLLFEYLSTLVSRPDLRLELGERAQRWVELECNWSSVAERYVAFLEAVVNGRDLDSASSGESLPTNDRFPRGAREQALAPEEIVENEHPPIEPEYIHSWAAEPEARKYVETHSTRLAKTLEITPAGGPDDRILEMGAYLQITPALHTRLGYGEVRACYYGQLGTVEHRRVQSVSGEEFECDVELFDAEKDRFPYDDEYFSTVLCCELIEHLFNDPMHMISEVNRILQPGGYFVLTTPNIVSLRAISAILQGYHPGFFPAYIKPSESGFVDARHNREYTPREMKFLFHDAGFETVSVETGAFRDEPKPEHEWVLHLLEKYRLPQDLRGDGIYAVGRKTGPVRVRYPAWLYN